MYTPEEIANALQLKMDKPRDALIAELLAEMSRIPELVDAWAAVDSIQRVECVQVWRATADKFVNPKALSAAETEARIARIEDAVAKLAEDVERLRESPPPNRGR